ncbi:hypothetical protein ID866_328 [Astraeus odoratus]|nr:hypothetical protein ID866_328 [Astraeus odoratus]
MPGGPFRGARGGGGGGRGGAFRGGASGRGAPRGGGRGGVSSRGGRGGGGRGGGGRGAPRGGRGAKPSRGGPRGRGGAKVILEPHRHPGIFIAKGKDHLLVTKNLVPGESVYGEKRITIEGGVDDTKIEYRVWNPFRSKLAAGVLGGMDDIYIAPGKKVLYLGAASGTSVSHVADIVGPARIVIHNAQYFLKDGGYVVISIKASCIDSTAAPSAVFVQEVQKLRESKFKPIAQITLEPYERDHAMVTAQYQRHK